MARPPVGLLTTLISFSEQYPVSTSPIRWKQPILTDGSAQPYILRVGGDISCLTEAAIASSRDILKDAVLGPVSMKRHSVIRKLYTGGCVVIKEPRTELTVVVNANLPVLCCNWCPRYKAPGLHVPQSCLNLCPDKMDSRLSVVGNAPM
jgi:hypothetical protein